MALRARAPGQRRLGERGVQPPGQALAAGVVADGDEVDVGVMGGSHEAQQVGQDLAVGVAGDESRVAELDDEHRMVQVPRPLAVPPEPREVRQYPGQVGVTGPADRDLGHGGPP
jgi:hypothetical protein